MSITTSVAVDTVKKSSMPISNSKTLYVGGSGEGNYTWIQSAIWAASDGDTVFVYDDLSPYKEHVVVDKSINLIGENRNTTVIDGKNVGDVVNISADNVILKGFTIQNSGEPIYPSPSGILIRADYVTIIGNIIINNAVGITSKLCDYNCIKKNDISFCLDGITLRGTQYCNISNNNIKYNGIGIWIWHATWWEFYSITNISRNTITFNRVGIYLDGIWVQECRVFRNNIRFNGIAIEMKSAILNNISYNNLKNNLLAIRIWDDSCNTFFRNNFIRNLFEVESYSYEDIWIENYWNRPRRYPKPIMGRKLGTILIFSIYVPCLMFDWRPALKPYDI